MQVINLYNPASFLTAGTSLLFAGYLEHTMKLTPGSYYPGMLPGK
jgi:hypothetical protein